MAHEILTAGGVRADIGARILARHERLQRVVKATVDPQATGWTPRDLTTAADMLALALSADLTSLDGVGMAQGLRAARLVVEDLTERAERGTSAFWASPLGRACGWWIGGIVTGSMPEDGVPLAIVGAIVGMSRQGVHEARNKGRFGTSTTAISPEDVQAWMHRTYPLVTS